MDRREELLKELEELDAAEKKKGGNIKNQLTVFLIFILAAGLHLKLKLPLLHSLGAAVVGVFGLLIISTLVWTWVNRQVNRTDGRGY